MSKKQNNSLLSFLIGFGIYQILSSQKTKGIAGIGAVSNKPIKVNTVWDDVDISKLKGLAKEFYKNNITGKSVINIDKQITVNFSMNGFRHFLFYHKKISADLFKAVLVLDKMVSHAKFKNFGAPKPKDGKDVQGYLIFEVKVNTGKNINVYQIMVKASTSGKYYYHHAINIKSSGQ